MLILLPFNIGIRKLNSLYFKVFFWVWTIIQLILLFFQVIQIALIFYKRGDFPVLQLFQGQGFRSLCLGLHYNTQVSGHHRIIFKEALCVEIGLDFFQVFHFGEQGFHFTFCNLRVDVFKIF